MSNKIYVLALCHNRFYVGRSSNFSTRLREHIINRGSQWTKQWPVKYVVSVVDENSPFDEDIITKKYMLLHGIKYVRGGSYFNPNLTILQLMALQAEFDTALHLCFECGMYLTRFHKCSTIHSHKTSCYYCNEVGHRMENCNINLNSFAQS